MLRSSWLLFLAARLYAQSERMNMIIPELMPLDDTSIVDIDELLMTDTIAEQPKSACDDGSCYPAVGDLLIGRETNLTATSTCGIDVPERYCIVSHLNSAKKCFWCHSDNFNNRNDHSIQKAISNDLSNRLQTWWQSENAPNNTVSITLDLEAQFHFTHLIMTFKTFRPAAMVIERSNDYGKTWKPYRFFADDCENRFRDFNMNLETSQVNIDDVICDDRYSKIEPSTMGEVIYKALDPSAKMPQDPYSPRVQDWILITNLRINMTAFHTLGDDILDPNAESEVNQKYYYSLYELIIRGNCFCYGHAEECEPVEGMYSSNEVSEHMVHGQCKCMHNTAGRNCEKCKPLYNNKPWAPAMHKTTNECELCNCNDHADSCSFNQALYDQNGGQNGGVCDNCAHNTMGVNCEQCMDGYYRDYAFTLQHPNACTECQCNPDGSVYGNVCDKENTDSTTAGYCRCKANVEGESCDRCKPGFYNLDPNNPDGCSPCNCHKLGTIMDDNMNTCDTNTGSCFCKENVQGRYCDECKDEFWGLDKDAIGCKPCDCVYGASESNVCDKQDGQCGCLQNLMGRQCDTVADQHFVPYIDHFCYEAEDAVGSSDTDKLVEAINVEDVLDPGFYDPLDNDYFDSDDSEEFITDTDFTGKMDSYQGSGGGKVVNQNNKDLSITRKWTGDGFMKVNNNSTLTFDAITVTKTQDYCLAIRYKIQPDLGYEPVPVDVNVQITDKNPEIKTHPNSTCYNTGPGDTDINIQLNPYEYHKLVCNKNLCLEEEKEYSAYLQFTGNATIDSLIVVPEARGDQPAYPVDNGMDPGEVDQAYDSQFDDSFTGEYQHYAESNRYITDNIYAGCVDAVIALPKNISVECQKVLFGVTTNFFNGAKPCECNPQGSLSQNCQKNGGQCVCRKNVIGRTCNRCAPYTYGFSGGSDGCEKCNCDERGTVYNTMCDRQSGQCRCRPGVTGRTCNTCKPGHYGFPNCYPCDCNSHADECDSDTGVCSNCSDHTEGDHCDRCIDGYYGDATTSYCRECMCPDGPNSSRQFAKTCSMNILDSISDNSIMTEICHCDEGYTGDKCDTCAPGYYGNPDEDGGRCIRCECNGNIDMVEGACHPKTGQCLLCNRNTAGDSCERCLHGYFPDGTGGCIPCGCSSEGSNPENCIDGVCGCDQETGKCDCLDTVDGDYCDVCKPQFYGLVAGVGCSPCNCDPEQSIIPNCHEETGQCQCKQGFGGRDCSGCEIGYYGIPSVTGCNYCACNTEGSVGTYVEELDIYVHSCDEFGQCDCLEGIGGKRCDECAYGYYEEYLYADPQISEDQSGLICQKCDQCFYDWDKSIKELKRNSDAVLDQAKELQKTGITGRYTSKFSALDNILEQVENILDESVSPEVEHKLEQFEALRGALNTQRQNVLAEQNLIEEIQKNDNTLREKVRQFASRLEALENRIQIMQETIQRCAKNTPEVAAQQIETAQKKSRQALADAEILTDHNDPESKINQAKSLREEAEEIANARQNEFNQENAGFQATIESGLSAAKEITIGVLNEKICGVNTETCDPICGGAGCEFCGAKEGEELASPCQGSATQAAQAAAMAKKAKDSLADKLKSSGTMLKKVKDANQKVELAQDKVSDTHTLAEKLNKRIGSKNIDIKKIIEKIKVFLMEKRDDPDTILSVASNVLDIPIPTEGEVADVVARLEKLANEIDNMSGQLDTGGGFGNEIWGRNLKILPQNAPKTNLLFPSHVPHQTHRSQTTQRLVKFCRTLSQRRTDQNQRRGKIHSRIRND